MLRQQIRAAHPADAGLRVASDRYHLTVAGAAITAAIDDQITAVAI